MGQSHRKEDDSFEVPKKANHVIQVAVLGSRYSGKTSTVRRLLDDPTLNESFEQGNIPNKNKIEISQIVIEDDNAQYTIVFYELGSEIYDLVTPLFNLNTDFYFIVNNPDEEIRRNNYWESIIKSLDGYSIESQIVYVQTFKESRTEELKEKENVFEISNHTGEGIDELREYLYSKINDPRYHAVIPDDVQILVDFLEDLDPGDDSIIHISDFVTLFLNEYEEFDESFVYQNLNYLSLMMKVLYFENSGELKDYLFLEVGKVVSLINEIFKKSSLFDEAVAEKELDKIFTDSYSDAERKLYKSILLHIGLAHRTKRGEIIFPVFLPYGVEEDIYIPSQKDQIIHRVWDFKKRISPAQFGYITATLSSSIDYMDYIVVKNKEGVVCDLKYTEGINQSKIDLRVYGWSCLGFSFYIIDKVNSCLESLHILETDYNKVSKCPNCSKYGLELMQDTIDDMILENKAILICYTCQTEYSTPELSWDIDRVTLMMKIPKYCGISDHMEKLKYMMGNSALSRIKPLDFSKDQEYSFSDLQNKLLELNESIYKERVEYGELLGDGDFSKVYKGIWNAKTIAIKDIDIPAISGKLSANRTLSEVNILRQIHHENIISFIGYFTYDDTISVLLEYIEGRTLNGVIREREDPFDDDDVLMIAEKIGKALKYCHSKGVIHGNLTSENIIVNLETETVKLIGFAQSQLIDNDGFEGDACYSPQFCAPEQMFDDENTFAIDIYAYGGVLLHLSSMSSPWNGLSEEEISNALRNNQTPPIPDNVDPKYKNIIERCIKIKPRERINASELLFLLQILLLDPIPTPDMIE
eukprot:TRINITY_DN1173_c0_g2_i1.p1 TRINITY_DN1173_c0_g2~~TRINITY_DN1173_c0_g2_i1.p1  ORF type:complete len:813 (+),score=169.06 TRINITY_DN1173_c0_g2_i1:778-3216(+)